MKGEIVMKDSQRLEPVIEPAVKTLQAVFRPGEPEEGDLMKARLASSVLSTWARLRASERAQETLYFNMAQALATDREQLAHYIELTMPNVIPIGAIKVKALPKKTGG